MSPLFIFGEYWLAGIEPRLTINMDERWPINTENEDSLEFPRNRRVKSVSESDIEYPSRFWADGFLYNPSTQSVFLHKRDGHAVEDPNKWAFFGGKNEGGESSKDCYIREMCEEIGLKINAQNIYPLTEYMHEDLRVYRYVFYSLSEAQRSQFVLGEGAGFDWVRLTDVDQYDLSKTSRMDLEYFMDQLDQ